MSEQVTIEQADQEFRAWLSDRMPELVFPSKDAAIGDTVAEARRLYSAGISQHREPQVELRPLPDNDGGAFVWNAQELHYEDACNGVVDEQGTIEQLKKFYRWLSQRNADLERVVRIVKQEDSATASRAVERRDTDWVLAMGHALGLDSGFEVPIVPEVEPFKKLFAAVADRAKAEHPADEDKLPICECCGQRIIKRAESGVVP